MSEQRSLMVVGALVVLVGVFSSMSSALELNCDKMENCTCPEFYIISSDRSQCLQRLALPYSACNASEQCADRMVIGAICANNICACAEGFHYLHGRCWKSVGLGGECSTSEQCHVNYDHQSATCNLKVGLCECSFGYYSRGGIDCRREAKAIGESCGIDADCRFEGATCYSNYTCQLKSVASHFPSDKGLFAVSEDDDADSPDTSVNGSVVKVGDSCADNSSCSGLANSNCFLGECACLPGYYALQGNDTCYTELGGSCAKDSDCVRADDVLLPEQNLRMRCWFWSHKGQSTMQKK
uniref:EB domain-containing protein n=1 Tax=Timema cristinae TaxID=61476 RepID=A0A7R9D6Y1_TIMCR|nr:unnamed protein product [Timema cristinae]